MIVGPTEWGAKAYAAFQTVIATAKRKDEDIFHALVEYMGTPVLQYLKSSCPCVITLNPPSGGLLL
jgi:hypothetical protein